MKYHDETRIQESLIRLFKLQRQNNLVVPTRGLRYARYCWYRTAGPLGYLRLGAEAQAPLPQYPYFNLRGSISTFI
ncbi:hypothetical protein EVAR_28456_1 [Eumeta japonica]|uniref:Uncharacterized protein n=1 Tax=Eumeta variegata TaxID=151549 RepID=A0A4C1V7Z4_EUMVA|nr:hypothetical protein EVAR_28456_1 [Eumeta japonica]